MLVVRRPWCGWRLLPTYCPPGDARLHSCLAIRDLLDNGFSHAGSNVRRMGCYGQGKLAEFQRVMLGFLPPLRKSLDTSARSSAPRAWSPDSRRPHFCRRRLLASSRTESTTTVLVDGRHVAQRAAVHSSFATVSWDPGIRYPPLSVPGYPLGPPWRFS
jgi:hypothetical protein